MNSHGIDEINGKIKDQKLEIEKRLAAIENRQFELASNNEQNQAAMSKLENQASIVRAELIDFHEQEARTWVVLEQWYAGVRENDARYYRDWSDPASKAADDELRQLLDKHNLTVMYECFKFHMKN